MNWMINTRDLTAVLTVDENLRAGTFCAFSIYTPPALEDFFALPLPGIEPGIIISITSASTPPWVFAEVDETLSFTVSDHRFFPGKTTLSGWRKEPCAALRRTGKNPLSTGRKITAKCCVYRL